MWPVYSTILSSRSVRMESDVSVWNVDWFGGARCGSGGRNENLFLGIGVVRSGNIFGVVVGGWGVSTAALRLLGLVVLVG